MHRITRDVLLDMEEDDEEDGDVGECLASRVSAPLRARIDAGSRGGRRGCFSGHMQAGAAVSGPHCSRSGTSGLQPGPEQQRGGRLDFWGPLTDWVLFAQRLAGGAPRRSPGPREEVSTL